MGLQFDPEGADFSRWMQQFKNEVYRNWVVPQSALWGWGGQVSFEFVVERSGAMVALTNLAGSGTAALDRAAQNALTASRLLPLPEDYAPSQITMRVTFNYGPPAAARAQADHSSR
jgi:TonB family protein